MADTTAIEWTDAQKVAARYAVNLAVKRGDIPRPNSLHCVDCGHLYDGTGNRHEYDHHLGYAESNFLDVQAVCKRCHVARDNMKSAQTHCLNGHAFTPENTKLRSNGTRECRQCRRLREKKKRTAEWWREKRKKGTGNG